MTNYTTLRRLAAVLAASSALAACSGWPYSGDPQKLATYDPTVGALQNGRNYDPPMRGNYIVQGWHVTEARVAADSHQPVVASLADTRIPTSFLQGLDSDYASFASSLESNRHEWADADYFSRKGLTVADGQPVPPEDNRNWLIPGNYRPMLADARVRLVADLDGGGRDRAPALAARAQVSYDCWVENMETTWWTAVNGPCRQQFEAALNRLEQLPAQAAAETPAAPEYQYGVYFDFDKSNLTPAARLTVTHIADQIRSIEDLRAFLVGKADLVGTDAYNMGLSERRAAAVRTELANDGVQANLITIRWVGKREPPVPTPGGVREPRNRVVEVTLSGGGQQVSQR
jgi:OmpA-OmpF porin, OOP family